MRRPYNGTLFSGIKIKYTLVAPIHFMPYSVGNLLIVEGFQ